MTGHFVKVNKDRSMTEFGGEKMILQNGNDYVVICNGRILNADSNGNAYAEYVVENDNVIKRS